MIYMERRNTIKDMLLKDGAVKVTTLAELFEVSEETIRRDLSQLEREGLVRKNYGGAVLVEELRHAMMAITPVQQRKFQYITEKAVIGRKAAEFVKPGSVVVMDAGSTTWCVASSIRDIPDITVITNSIDIAGELSLGQDASVYLLGGKLIKKSMCLVGPQSEAELRTFNADVAFLGTSGVSLTKGFITSDIYEAEIKRAMSASAGKVIVVADHSKLQKGGMITFNRFADVDILITSSLADRETCREIERQGVRVILCPLDETADVE